MEDYLDDVSLHDNPYEGMVDECVRRQSQQVFTQSPRGPYRQSRDDFAQARPGIAFPERSTPQEADLDQLNNSGVKITVNDDGCDVADVGTSHVSRWVCCSQW